MPEPTLSGWCRFNADNEDLKALADKLLPIGEIEARLLVRLICFG